MEDGRRRDRPRCRAASGRSRRLRGRSAIPGRRPVVADMKDAVAPQDRLRFDGGSPTVTVPLLGSIRPAAALRVVVLPEPFGTEKCHDLRGRDSSERLDRQRDVPEGLANSSYRITTSSGRAPLPSIRATFRGGESAARRQSGGVHVGALRSGRGTAGNAGVGRAANGRATGMAIEHRKDLFGRPQRTGDDALGEEIGRETLPRKWSKTLERRYGRSLRRPH